MKFSVIVPTLNEEDSIKETLKSIKKQNIDDFEIIVVDGGSSDKTVEIAKKYADKVIIVKKRGIALARNTGAKKAIGDVLIFIDADTIIAKNYLSEIKKTLFDERIVCGTTRYMAIKSSKASNRLLMKSISELNKILSVFDIIRCPGFSTFIRKKIFDRINGYDESLFMFEDHDLAIRAKKYGKFAFVDETFVKTSTRRLEKIGIANLSLYYIYAELTNIWPLKGRIKTRKKYPTVDELSKNNIMELLKRITANKYKRYSKNIKGYVKKVRKD